MSGQDRRRAGSSGAVPRLTRARMAYRLSAARADRASDLSRPCSTASAGRRVHREVIDPSSASMLDAAHRHQPQPEIRFVCGCGVWWGPAYAGSEAAARSSRGPRNRRVMWSLVGSGVCRERGGGSFEPPSGKTVELGGIEPPSVKGSPAAIRPFPV